MEITMQSLYWGNTIESYLVSFSIFFGIIVGIKLIKYFIIHRLKKWAKKTKSSIDDFAVQLLDQIHFFAFFVFAVFLVIQRLEIHEIISNVVYYIFVITITVEAIRLIQELITFSLENYEKRRAKQDKEPLDRSIVQYTQRMVNVCLWALGVIIILGNLGYNVSSLVAGLGIGGLAIALASQKFLSNFLNSLFIIFDKPFKVGDYINIGDDMGTVQDVGLRSTKIKTLRGEELILPNSDIMDSRIHNFKRMKKRRIVFKISVTYETALKKLKSIPKLICNIIAKQSNVETKKGMYRSHFTSYGDSALNFESMYYITSNSYDAYLDTQQSINFAIAEMFENEGIDFAYPTSTVYLKK